MKRGEIYYIESTYRETGSEQRGGRPAVIVSNDKNNENSEVVEVVYMTTKPKNDLPTHVFIRSALSPESTTVRTNGEMILDLAIELRRHPGHDITLESDKGADSEVDQ